MAIRSTILMLALLGLAACQTAAGFGQDVEDTGEAITGAAVDVAS